ncbi:MAG: hypothetical protein R3B06_01880 [Kofleriaceae bacterium]
MDQLRLRLLDLHRALIEVERVALERTRGRLTATALWHLLVEDPALAWLGPLSSVIVRLDEGVAVDDEADLRATVRALLTADPDGAPFQRRYAELLQAAPEVVLAHRAVTRAW